MTNAMTKGNILRHILLFSIPLLLGNIFQQTYNMVDASIVGKTLGVSALASVGVSSSIQFMVLGFSIGTALGLAIPVATSFGANDFAKMRRYIFTGYVLTATIAVLLTALTTALCATILRIMDTPIDIYEAAYQYLIVIFLGLPCTLFYNYLSGIIRAIGDSKTPFYFLAFSAVLNIFLDFFCILVLHWGVAGAAIATVVSQGISTVLCFLLIHKKISILQLQKEDCIFDKGMFLHSLNMGVPMGLQYSITAIGSMFMQTANNGLGTVYVSAYAAGMKIKQFMMCPFDSFATATATFVSQNLGAGELERIKIGIKKGVLVAFVYSIFATLVMVLFGRSLSLLFVDKSAKDVLDASGQYLRYIGWFYWGLAILNVTRMSVQGLGYSRLAVFNGVIEMIARMVVSLVFVPLFGFNAICCADQAAWLSADLYIVPVLFYVLKRIEQNLDNQLHIKV